MNLFNKLVVFILPIVPKVIIHMFAKRYIAGPSLQDAISTVRQLNVNGMCATMDILGESATKKEETINAMDEYHNVLETIRAENLDCNISIKPTQLGMKINEELCYNNIKKIVEKARNLNNFVRIDMEDSQVTSDTIEIFRRLQKDYDNVGIVIQAYLRRSVTDVNCLIETKTNFRLCKGIYIEPREIAYKDPQIVNKNFSYLLEKMLQNGCYVGIATHDERIVWEALRIIDELQLERNSYEFQMLLGVAEDLRKILVDSGHKVRVYVPFGEKWHAYSMRRLKENPRIATYILKAIFGIR